MPGRIFREPAAQYALFLKEHLVDAPETAEGKAAYDDGQDVVLDKQGECGKSQTRRQPNPPALFPPSVFHFDNQGMTDADAQEYGCADEDTTVIHIVLLRLQISAKPMKLL